MKLGLGMAAIGRPHYINVRQEENSFTSLNKFRKDGLALLDEAYTLGVRYFDTAPGYGIAEQLIIDWVKLRKCEDLEIATKWGYTYTAQFNKNATVHEIKEHGIDKLDEQWQQSRELLPYLTTYQIHSATFNSGVLENRVVLERLAELKSKHQLHIGLTSTGVDQWEILQKANEIEVGETHLFDVYQVTYNVLDQSLQRIIEQLTASNKRVVIKEALANGRIFKNVHYPHYSALYEELQRLAIKYQVGVDAIALRFCLDSIDPFILLSGASSVQQLSENMKSLRFKLEKAEVEGLYEFAAPPNHYWSERKQLAWN